MKPTTTDTHPERSLRKTGEAHIPPHARAGQRRGVRLAWSLGGVLVAMAVLFAVFVVLNIEGVRV